MTNEKLIEEAAKAMQERATWPSLHWPPLHAIAHADVAKALAAAALAVFEKAHTSTDDEPDLPNGHAPIDKLSPFLARRIRMHAPSAKELLDAIYDPDEDSEDDSARFGYIVDQYERLTSSSSEPQGEPSDAQARLDRIAGFIDSADDGEEPPTLREIYLIARGRA